MSDDDIQGAGRQALLSLHMLSKSVRIYSTDNAIFLKPLQLLLEHFNRIVARVGQVELAVVGPAIYLNGELIRIEHAHTESLRQLAQLFQAHGIGGLKVTGPTTLTDLRNFFQFFTVEAPQLKEGEERSVPENGLPGFPLGSLHVLPWAAHKEKEPEPEEADADADVLRAQRRLVAYARAILWTSHQERQLREGKSDRGAEGCSRISQDLVEACCDFGDRVLSLLINGDGERALSHHLVNSAVVAVVFARRLGFSKTHLKDLAVAALTNELTASALSPELRTCADLNRLDAPSLALRSQAWQRSAIAALHSGPTARANHLRAVTAVQMHEPFAAPASSSQQPASEANRALLASRVLALASHFDILTSPGPTRASYGADQALGALWGPLRNRYDPDLLSAFVRIMATLPVKVLPRSVGGIVDVAR